ncbi:MAG: translation initiation factor IF-2 [Myxococcota bacterium]|nr:translation initiation factor IF-2 [Myxococcota bacterium]
MAKIRAYKLAEELGIDRHDFVDRAAEAGVVLKNSMASLDEEQEAQLRQKLGQPEESGKLVVESRVERKGGKTVLRRRKRVKVEEPPPEPEPVVEAALEAGEESLPESEAVVAEGVAPEGAEAISEAPEEVAAEAEVQQPAQAPQPGAARPGTETPDRRPATAKPDAQQATPDRKGRQRKRVREVVNLQEQERFTQQITGRGAQPRRTADMGPRAVVNPRRKRRDKLAVPAARPPADQKRVVKIAGEISVGELAKLLGAKAAAVQGKLMALGIMVSINQRVDFETCRNLATEYGIEVQDVGFKEEAFINTGSVPAASEEIELPGTLENRPPIITVMGHVDHGKTSLLDAIRNAKLNVADSEAGGITQHIGAYQVTTGEKKLTFIDTPGHAAFTAMRARGAAVTDIVVLVVAANDGVMPQTVEAIEHAQAAGCPIVVAVNKVDLSDADPEKTKQRLTEHNLVPEDFGGDVICVNVSAKTGEGIENLLEMLALQTEVMELQAAGDRQAKGVVLDARLDKGRGPVATVLIQDGTLKRGDVIVVESEFGRVRVMEDDLGNKVTEAGPSMPVQVLGLSGVPSAGAGFHSVESDRVAKQIAAHRADQERGKIKVAPAKYTLEEFFAQAGGEGPKELPIVLKADVQGTCEAVRDALNQLSTESVRIKILSAGVGAINENDVMLASASGAVVVGFHVRPDPAARRAADGHGVDLRTYTIIMQLLDDITGAMVGLLPAVRNESMLGRAEVRQLFVVPRVGTIAGSMVVEGKASRDAHCRLVRDGTQVFEGKMGSLRRFKEDVREVPNGNECGIGITNFNDLKIGDEIEIFEVEEVPATL